MCKPLEQQFFPLPHGVTDPYGHLACDDPKFLAACEHDSRVWQAHQVNTRAMLAGVREKLKIGREKLRQQQELHGDLTFPVPVASVPKEVPLADCWWW